MYVICMVSPCLWPMHNPRHEGRDNCVALAAFGTSSLYCFPAGGGRKPVRPPHMAPLSQPRVTGSEITRLHHMFTKFQSVVFTVLRCAGLRTLRRTLSPSARRILRSATNRCEKPKTDIQTVALINFVGNQ
jgi:hypothetical protein